MDLLICFGALGLLIYLAYRGHSVIIVAPLAAILAVVLTSGPAAPIAFSGLYMDKLASFVKLYLPLFLLGAVFGKMVEISGVAQSLVSAITKRIGSNHAILAITLVGMVLTYGGVSVFVVVFATYPFAVEMFRQSNIPKRLMPATLAFSAFTITMDALPGTPQIQNIIPTTFFGTTAYAGPVLGVAASLFTFTLALRYLLWQQKRAAAAGEGYGEHHRNEPETLQDGPVMPLWLAAIPLLCVVISNRVFLMAIQSFYGATATAVLSPAMAAAPLSVDMKATATLWAVEVALILGISAVAVIGWKAVRDKFAIGSQAAVAGSLLAAVNTASEYGFGAVIAALPGFHRIAEGLSKISDPLLNVALTTNILCGMTGSASGGLSLTLGALGDRFVAAAHASGIPLEVMHRIASLSSGGMDSLPHNGAVVTLLAVTGLTHREAYKDIFAITIIKTASAFFAIGVFYATGLV